ncbi:hypothetical protein [Amycolatopsis minnesotensis]
MSPERVVALQRVVGMTTMGKALGEQQTAVPVQRVEDGTEAHSGKGAVERERALSAKYGIRIGPAPGTQGKHFSTALLDKIESVLQELPQEDLGPNEKLVAIEMDTSTGGSASAYDYETGTIGIVLPIIVGGIRAPQWLYAKFNKGVGWQRAQMDKGAMADYPGVSKKGDRAIGIGKGERQVLGGVPDVPAQGNLVEWVLRHEVGHSVDARVKWERDLAGQDHFGGWQSYEDHDVDRVAEAILESTGLTNLLPARESSSSITTLANILTLPHARKNITGEPNRLQGFLSRYQKHLPPAEFSARSAAVFQFAQMALAQPWTLPDGGSGVLDVAGRTYQVDQHNTWVSYATEQRRQYALSNYQFSSPKEWFAEAYAAFYGPDPRARDRLHPQVRDWFATLPRPVPEDSES